MISVDTKKKELVGDIQERRAEWRPGTPQRVQVHDFLINPARAKPFPTASTTSRNEGWVSVGIDHDTATFAVKTIRRWWQQMGRPAIRAHGAPDHRGCGGQQRSPPAALEVGPAELANRTGLAITVCHFPPGTSKWNKIEHRLFSHIAKNWRGKPLVDLATIVS